MAFHILKKKQQPKTNFPTGMWEAKELIYVISLLKHLGSLITVTARGKTM